jgi:hypothetical protein
MAHHLYDGPSATASRSVEPTGAARAVEESAECQRRATNIPEITATKEFGPSTAAMLVSPCVTQNQASGRKPQGRTHKGLLRRHDRWDWERSVWISKVSCFRASPARWCFAIAVQSVKSKQDGHRPPGETLAILLTPGVSSRESRVVMQQFELHKKFGQSALGVMV